MNTVKSFWIGWGSLCIAGGLAYYLAKQSINADRQTRYEAEQKRRRMVEAIERSSSNTTNKRQPTNLRGSDSILSQVSNQNGGPAQNDHSGSPSQEATSDPAPTRHAPESEGQRVREKSKYEAIEPYRSKKGDRFS